MCSALWYLLSGFLKSMRNTPSGVRLSPMLDLVARGLLAQRDVVGAHGNASLIERQRALRFSTTMLSATSAAADADDRRRSRPSACDRWSRTAVVSARVASDAAASGAERAGEQHECETTSVDRRWLKGNVRVAVRCATLNIPAWSRRRTVLLRRRVHASSRPRRSAVPSQR